MAEMMSDRPQPVSPSAMNPTREASVPGLIKSLADDVSRLFAQEVALAKTEVASAIKDIKAGVLSLAIGLGVLFMGVLVLLFTLVAALALVMQTWLAGLIVGGVVTVVGIVLLLKAKNSLNPEHIVPNRTIESLKKDEELVRRTVT